MFRKIAMALAIVAGMAFVAQPAIFANDQKSTAEKPAKKDPLDALIKKAQDNADAATKKGKTELATAYTNLADACKKEKEALNASPKDDKAIADAKAEVKKAIAAVEEAKKGGSSSSSTTKKSN